MHERHEEPILARTLPLKSGTSAAAPAAGAALPITASAPAVTPWHVVLLLATVATTTWAGALHQGIDLIEEPSRWTAGVPYALALLGILGVHELGHYIAARRRGVDVTLPYFIPAPFFLGTFGAFIRMRSIARDRPATFDIAVAGPLAGARRRSARAYRGIAGGFDRRARWNVSRVVLPPGGDLPSRDR